METLKMIIMSVTGNMGRRVDEKDFVKYLSYTKNWISPEHARRLFQACVQANLLEKDGDKYVPNFEIKGTLPIDFEVTESMVEKYTVQEDLFTTMLDYISRKKNVHRKEVLMQINRIKRDAVYITVEIAALIYCKMESIPCEEYYEAVEKKLVV